MIIEFMIALAIYDVAKFVGSVIIAVLYKDKSKKEIEIQRKTVSFEYQLRKKMEDNKD